MHAHFGPALLLGILLHVTSAGTPLQATSFRLPLESYPIGDNCLPWGGINPWFPRCSQPGKHVADDACAPNGTDVLAVADGRVRYAGKVRTCQNDWGWITVVEHTLEDGSRVCSVYGHCKPAPGVSRGLEVRKGQHIADINYSCAFPHIHFGIYIGAYGAPDGIYPEWLLGYLPVSVTCPEYPNLWPGNYVDPVRFVRDSVPVQNLTWPRVKALFR